MRVTLHIHSSDPEAEIRKRQRKKYSESLQLSLKVINVNAVEASASDMGLMSSLVFYQSCSGGNHPFPSKLYWFCSFR